MQEEVKVDDYITNAIYLFECGMNRLRWYKDTGEKRYLVDSMNYIDAATIYMKEIKK